MKKPVEETILNTLQLVTHAEQNRNGALREQTRKLRSFCHRMDAFDCFLEEQYRLGIQSVGAQDPYAEDDAEEDEEEFKMPDQD